jgi:hypothetical protein
MRKDASPAGDQFRADLERLSTRYARLVAAIARHRVSGWPYGVPPPIDHMPTYLETLLLATPVQYPRPRPLPPADIEETERRRRLAGVVSMKVHRRLNGASNEASTAERSRFEAADDAAWEWARAIARRTNPQWGPFRESSRQQVRKYLADVSDFCRRWRLQADWAPLALIDHHFMRVLHEADQFLPIVTFGSWAGDSIPLVVMLPGADPDAFAQDRIKFTQYRMVQRIPGPTPFTVNREPDQNEQRQYEREESSACVVLRWDGDVLGGQDSRKILAYFKEECAARTGQRLTKLEMRSVQSQLDPQIRLAREYFEQHGWRISTDAPLQDQAAWLARRLLAHATWEEIASAFSSEASAPALLSPVVGRACREFARIAELALPTPARRPRKGHLRA